MTGDLDYDESHDGRSGYDLGAGCTGCDGGIEKKPREEIFFASLSPPLSGMKVTWELVS
jgi:hypothetical protein